MTAEWSALKPYNKGARIRIGTSILEYQGPGNIRDGIVLGEFVTEDWKVVGSEVDAAGVGETSTRKFTTPTEKYCWNNKVDDDDPRLSDARTPLAHTHPPGDGEGTISFLAAANIAAYKVITSTGILADSSTSAHRGKVIGITTASVLSGFNGTAKGTGTISNASWTWTIGDKIYLNGTSLSTTAPSSGFIQPIGTATASDTIDINIGPSILL